MRICIVSDSYPGLPGAGGISYYSRTAAQALSQRGHDVHVLIGKRRIHRDWDDGDIHVHIRSVRWLPFLAPWVPGLGESCCLAWALYLLHRKHQFDIVEFPNWGGLALVSELLRIAPIVVRLHTSTADGVKVLQRSPTFRERFTIRMERLAACRALATVTHSYFHRDNMQAAYGLRNTQVIPHGVCIPPVTPAATPQTLAVLSVGPLNARKGADTLLASIPLVLASVPATEFWLVGGDSERRMEAFCQKHPALHKERVKFLGHVADAELDHLYSSCSLYASAAVYESFGLTFVEAMAHSKPVVGCAASAMPELIQEGRTGLLVPPNDPAAFAAAIIRLLQNAELCSRLGLAGRQRAAQAYSAERMAENIEQFFNEVVRQSNP